MFRFVPILIMLSLLLSGITTYAEDSLMRYEDKIRIREALKITKQVGDKIWPGFSKPSFVFLLIDNNKEYLIYHPKPSADFQFLGYDTILQSNLYSRPRVFPKFLLAAFPVVNGLSTIVAGTPENTKTNSTQWIIKVLHERLHQCQQSDPDYLESIKKLNLGGSDTTGSWMLNYPFPYDDSVVNMQYRKYSKAIATAVRSIDSENFKTAFENYREQRNNFINLLNEKDYTYFSFQVWQEGLARYTEYRFLTHLRNYKVSEEVTALRDFQPFPEYEEALVKTEYRFLEELDFKTGKRVTFYTLGYGEGRILDALSSKWRKKYFKKKFFIEGYSKKLLIH